VSNLDGLMIAQGLRELARRTRAIASELDEESQKVRLLALADDLDQQAADLELVRH